MGTRTAPLRGQHLSPLVVPVWQVKYLNVPFDYRTSAGEVMVLIFILRSICLACVHKFTYKWMAFVNPWF